jgi:hypothetical protein
MATLNQETLDLANAVRLALVTLRTLVNGNATDLAALETTNQSNLVAAINEVKAAAVDLSAYATTAALTSGLAGKAATAHTHPLAELTGVTPAAIGAATAAQGALAGSALQPGGDAGTPSGIVLTNATGNASSLSVNFAVTSLYANDAQMAGGVARSGLITALLSDPLPITSGGTGGDTAGAARTGLKVPASDISVVSGASAISNIVSINQTNYNILVANGTTNGSTLYIIV